MAEKKNHDCDCEHEHNHSCETEGCDCDCENEENMVVLQDEDGNDVKFHFVYNMEHEGKEYVFLQAAESENEDEIEIFSLKTVEENGETYDVLDPVDDETYDVLYEKLLLVASEDCCEDDDCDCHDEHCDCEHHNK